MGCGAARHLEDWFSLAIGAMTCSSLRPLGISLVPLQGNCGYTALSPKKLVGTPEKLWRIRSGNYRIVYSIEDEVRIIEIRSVGDRKQIYK